MATEAPLGLAHVALADAPAIVDEKGAFRFLEEKPKKELTGCQYFWCCQWCCCCGHEDKRASLGAAYREVRIEHGVLKYDSNILDTEHTSMLFVSGRRSLRIPLTEIRAIRSDPYRDGSVLIWVLDSASRINYLANPDEFIKVVCSEIDKATAAAAAAKAAPADMQR